MLIKGADVFRGAPEGVTFLGTEWAMNPVVRGDIVVSHFLDSVGGYRHKERRDRLLDILDVDLDWHMHQISDGERRRVQLVMGLMAPWDVLLLDEVTVDLDVLVRDDLLSFLKEESEIRGATILCTSFLDIPIACLLSPFKTSCRCYTYFRRTKHLSNTHHTHAPRRICGRACRLGTKGTCTRSGGAHHIHGFDAACHGPPLA